VNYNNSSSGKADRPGLRAQLVAAIAEAEVWMAAASHPWDYDAAEDAYYRAQEKLLELDRAEFGLEMHQAEVAEYGPNIELSEVEIEDEKLGDFCRGSEVCDWQLLAAYPGFEIGESLLMQKHRWDRVEKAAIAFLALVTGDNEFLTLPYGGETQVVGL